MIQCFIISDGEIQNTTNKANKVSKTTTAKTAAKPAVKPAVKTTAAPAKEAAQPAAVEEETDEP